MIKDKNSNSYQALKSKKMRKLINKINNFCRRLVLKQVYKYYGRKVRYDSPRFTSESLFFTENET